MKKVVLAGSVLLGSLLMAENKEVFNPKSVKGHIVIKVQALDEKKNKDAGEVVAVQTEHGVAFFPNLKGLAPGIHGFHIHENPDCGKTDKGLGMKAGGHWDPENTTNHSLAWDSKGHKGDLPALYVDADGKATNPVLAPKIKDINEIKKHALMIHAGGDNHSDHPAALGGGGARMACGVIK